MSHVTEMARKGRAVINAAFAERGQVKLKKGVYSSGAASCTTAEYTAGLLSLSGVLSTPGWGGLRVSRFEGWAPTVHPSTLVSNALVVDGEVKLVIANFTSDGLFTGVEATNLQKTTPESCFVEAGNELCSYTVFKDFLKNGDWEDLHYSEKPGTIKVKNLYRPPLNKQKKVSIDIN